MNHSRLVPMGRFFHKTVNLLLIISFTLIATATFIGYVTLNTITSPQNYVEIIEKTEVAKRGRSILVNVLMTYSLFAQSGQNVTFLQRYSMQTWETIAEVTVPIPWLETNLQKIMVTSIEWLNQEGTQLPEIILDLTQIRDIFSSPQGALAILPLMADIPRCPPDTLQIVLMEKDLVNCLPENYDLTSLAQLISNNISASIPGNISLDSLEAMGFVTAEIKLAANKLRISVEAAMLAINLGFRASILLLCLYALLHSSTPGRLVQSLPWPLYTAGGLSILLLGIWHFLVEWGTGLPISTFMPGLRIEAQTLLIDAIHTFSGLIENQWLRGSLVLLGIAFIVHILAIGINRYQNRRFNTHNQQNVRSAYIRKQFR